MPAPRKISGRQIETLLDQMEQSHDLATGRYSSGPHATQATRRRWRIIAAKLNCIGDGVIKTPEQWRRYWIEFKAKTKAKGADSRRSVAPSEGYRNRLAPLNSIEERILDLIGNVRKTGIKVEKTLSEDNVSDSVLQDRDPLATTSSVQNIPKNMKPRENHLDEISSVPQSEHTLEARRVAAELRVAEAIERLTCIVDNRLATLDETLRGIRDEMCRHNEMRGGLPTDN